MLKLDSRIPKLTIIIWGLPELGVPILWIVSKGKSLLMDEQIGTTFLGNLHRGLPKIGLPKNGKRVEDPFFFHRF